jgi:hypothetical protein
MERRSAPSLVRPAPLVGLLVLCLAAALPARAQLVLGQYEDEAPLATWNVFGLTGAPARGLGGVRIGRGFDASVSTTNPALLPTLPRASACLTASYTAASLYRFSIVNTGVLATSLNVSVESFALETAAFAVRAGGWAFAVTAGILENFARPLVRSGDAAVGVDQSGVLRLWNAAAARRFGRRLSFGVGLNLVEGRLDRAVYEVWTYDGIAITDDRSERFRGFYVNAGLRLELSPSVAVSLAGRTPYLRRAEAASRLRYEAPDADIRIEADARNEYRQPWVAGAGLDWRWAKDWSLVADLAYFGWSRYRALYFDEPLARDFRDVLTASAGLERVLAGRLGSRPVLFPLRLGLAYDRQPMAEVRSSYISLTAGAGLRAGRWTADLSGRLGRESGSGNGLWAGGVALGLNYAFDDRR